MTNNVQVWQCLKAATEALQEGDLATAQTLLDVQGCTCPSGQLWSRVYDDRGAEYKVPEWLVIEPAGIVEREDAPVIEDRANDASALDDTELGREFVIRVRFSSLSPDLKMEVREREIIASIREKCKVLAKVSLSAQDLLGRASATSVGGFSCIACANCASWTMTTNSDSFTVDACTKITKPSNLTTIGVTTTTTFFPASYQPESPPQRDKVPLEPSGSHAKGATDSHCRKTARQS